MAKLCNCGCGRPVFSHGFAVTCQYKRTDEKYLKAKAHKKKLKEKRPRIKRTPLKPSRKPTGELAMFLEIYEEYKDKWVSQLSGKPLIRPGEFLFVNQFAHILPKGKYPEQRLNKDNIFLLTASEHMLFDFGTIEKRVKYAKENNCDWNELYNRKNDEN